MPISKSDQEYKERSGSPRVSKEPEITIMSAQLLTGAYLATDVLDVRRTRRVDVSVQVNAGSAANRVSLIPVISKRGGLTALPLPAEDVWTVPCEPAAPVASAAQGSGVPAGVDFTVADSFALIDANPAEIRMPACAADTAEHRWSFTLLLESAFYLYFLVTDADASGTRATVSIRASRLI